MRLPTGLLSLALVLAALTVPTSATVATGAAPAPRSSGAWATTDDSDPDDPDDTAEPIMHRPSRPLRVKVLSNRADLISAGDALVEVVLPRKVKAREVRVRVGQRDVTHRFKVRADGRYLGLVKGMRLGRNVVRATAGKHASRIVITNHRNGGPVFTGPQLGNYHCQESARDKLCNEPARYSYLYKSRNPLRPDLQPYDPENPPSDLATTTTQQGDTVPFIVRREDGYQDRDRYSILTLFTPGQKWRPWAPQKTWNHKVLITHGGNCGASYTPGKPPLQDYSGTLDGAPGYASSYIDALGAGFAVLSTALAHTGHNCNVAMEAESLMMAKERLVERYGELRYTIGTGCSGGSIAQHTIANAYPGIYQGLVTTCSYPDTLTAGAQFADYHLMRLYFENPSRWAPGVVWTPTQMAAVEGHVSHANAITSDELLFKAALNPEHACSGTKTPVAGDRSTRYDSEINPGGVRCSVLDIMVNLLGPRPKSVWTKQEKAAGRGFSGIPLSNTGIQYGLGALRLGQITPAQFVDLNEKLGGLDVDSQFQADRMTGDKRAIKRVYRTGLINETTHFDEVAIINHGGPDPGAAHDFSHAFWTKERMLADQGHTGNRVMWFGVAPLIGDPRWAAEAMFAMDRWLSAVEKDRSKKPLAEKVVSNRPADINDRCANVPGLEMVPGPDGRPACQMAPVETAETRYSTPRQVAGGPAANDNVACRLRPLDRADYEPLGVFFTADQWTRLEKVFTDGVCDWDRAGRGQGPAETWLRYDGKHRKHAYGGRNLPAVPKRSAGGWFSPTFAEMLRR